MSPHGPVNSVPHVFGSRGFGPLGLIPLPSCSLVQIHKRIKIELPSLSLKSVRRGGCRNLTVMEHNYTVTLHVTLGVGPLGQGVGLVPGSGLGPIRSFEGRKSKLAVEVQICCLVHLCLAIFFC